MCALFAKQPEQHQKLLNDYCNCTCCQLQHRGCINHRASVPSEEASVSFLFVPAETLILIKISFNQSSSYMKRLDGIHWNRLEQTTIYQQVTLNYRQSNIKTLLFNVVMTICMPAVISNLIDDDQRYIHEWLYQETK